MARPKQETPRTKTCCMLSEILEQAGLDRAKARALRRQVLEGVILMCRWQLERMDEPTKGERAGTKTSSRRQGRRVVVE